MRSFKIEDLSIGDKLLFRYGKGNINNRTYEVRGVIDDLLAVRTRNRRTREYMYSFLDQFFLDLAKKNIKLVRQKGESA